MARVGLMVIIAWMTHQAALLQVFPNDVPMQFNTNQVVMSLASNAHQAMRESAPPRRLTVVAQASETHVRLRAEETGLGLSFGKGMLASHGGWIDVESEPGQRTVFQIKLPIGSAPPTAVVEMPPQIQVGRMGKRILIIDDEDSIRRALSRLLNRDGYAVETAL